MLGSAPSPSDPDEASSSAWFRALVDKPRERLLRDGVRGVSDAELIALLLGTGVRDRSVLQVADQVIRTIGGLASLASASPQELAQVKGVGTARAARIAAAFELGRRVVAQRQQRITLGSAADIFAYASAKLAREPQEVMLVIGVDTRNSWLDTVEIARGALATSTTEPRSVFRPLLRMAAAGGVVVHNHPSGDLTPSADDCAFTRHLRALGWLLGLPIIDHVIVTATEYCSLAEWLGTDF
jgi:DNA repair protein RadC